MIGPVEKDALLATLDLYPEVTWDRYVATETVARVYGWVQRPDGRADFVLLDFYAEGVWICTSSAEYSVQFAARLGIEPDDHTPCERVADLR